MEHDTHVMPHNMDEYEVAEWLESLDSVLESSGPEVAVEILERLRAHAKVAGLNLPFTANTPYVNTIPARLEAPFPGDQELERRIKSLIRWNAIAMVVRANRVEHNIGGHISTYASAATLYEVGFNHFFRARSEQFEGDTVYFQGHAAPGMYSRAFLEGRLSTKKLENFRRELKPGGGLCSYPHPWLMPDFWEYPTVSMGLGPLMSIYQARYARYLENRGTQAEDRRQSLGLPRRRRNRRARIARRDHTGFARKARQPHLRHQLQPAAARRSGSRQRPDHSGARIGLPRRTLERHQGSLGQRVGFHPRARHEGLLVKRMGELVDGEYQKLVVESGAYVRQHFFGTDPRLLKLVEPLSDEDLRRLRLGGHDPRKVYAAYKAAIEHKGGPTVILARTIKGYGLGEAGEGKNVTHQQKKLNEEELRIFRTRFDIPLTDQDCIEVPFYRPPEDSPEIKYLHERREALGGYTPARKVRATPITATRPRRTLQRVLRTAAKAAKSPRRWPSSACCAKC